MIVPIRDLILCFEATLVAVLSESGKKPDQRGIHNELEELLRPYGSEDSLCTLLSITLWPRNSSANIRLAWISTRVCDLVMRSRRPKSRQLSSDGGALRGSTYQELVAEIIKLAPTYWEDDYLPQVDWGGVTYCFGGERYKFFYGCPYDIPYEYWREFELYVESIDNPISRALARRDFHRLFKIQHSILSGVDVDDLMSFEGELSPGELEVPPFVFFERITNVIQGTNWRGYLGAWFLYRHRLKRVRNDAGELPRSSDELFAFVESGLFVCQRFGGVPVFPNYPLGAAHKIWSKRGLSKLSVKRGRTRRRFLKRIAREILRAGISRDVYLSPTIERGSLRCEHAVGAVVHGRLVLVYLASCRDSSELSADCKDLQGLIDEIGSLQSLELSGRNVRIETEAHDPGTSVRVTGENPHFLVLLPSLLTTGTYGLDFEFDGSLFQLTSFLGILDESESGEEFLRFLDFSRIERKRIGPLVSAFDLFYIFRGSDGIIEEGATNFDWIAIDPHEATRNRYDSLRRTVEYESISRIQFDRHGSRYRERPEGGFHVASRSAHEFATVLTGSESQVVIRISEESPNDESIARQIGFALELVELACQWYLALNIAEQVSSLVEIGVSISNAPDDGANERYAFEFSRGEIRTDTACLELRVDLAAVSRRFYEPNTRFQEWRLLRDLLLALGVTRCAVAAVARTSRDEVRAPPRFHIGGFEKDVAFPERSTPTRIRARDFKLARRQLAIIAARAGVKEGVYEMTSARDAIREFRFAFFKLIVEEVRRYNFFEAIQVFMIERGAIDFKYSVGRKRITQSSQESVSYDRESELVKIREEHLRDTRRLSFLVEVTNDQRHIGDESLSPDAFRYLVALVDWYDVIKNASDVVHYQIGAASLNLDSELVPSIEYSQDFVSKQEEYARRNIQAELRDRSNEVDYTDLEQDEKLFDVVSQVFRRRRGFSLEVLFGCLTVLTRWPWVVGGQEQPVYGIGVAEVVTKVAEELNCDGREVLAALEFLRLDEESMRMVIGKTQPEQEIPTWEIRKRPNRYPLRPVIRIGDRILWEPNACNQSLLVWSMNIRDGRLPFDLEDDQIQSAVSAIKKDIEDNLTSVGCRVISELGFLYQKELDLGRRFRNGGYPRRLGDYDVLAYRERDGLLLNVECKDIGRASCLKDAGRYLNKLYGRKGHETEGYYRKVEARGEYLRHHYERVLDDLDWPHPAANVRIKVASIFVVRKLEFWHFFGPRDYEVSAVQFDGLREHIASL